MQVEDGHARNPRRPISEQVVSLPTKSIHLFSFLFMVLYHQGIRMSGELMLMMGSRGEHERRRRAPTALLGSEPPRIGLVIGLTFVKTLVDMHGMYGVSREGGPELQTAGQGKTWVADELCPVDFPPVLKFACNAWSLGPHVDRCTLCAAAAPLELAHLFGRDGLFGLCRDVCPRAAWPRDPHGRLRAISGVGAVTDRLRLCALAIGGAWSSLVAGAPCRGSATGAFKARVRAVEVRSVRGSRMCTNCFVSERARSNAEFVVVPQICGVCVARLCSAKRRKSSSGEWQYCAPLEQHSV